MFCSCLAPFIPIGIESTPHQVCISPISVLSQRRITPSVISHRLCGLFSHLCLHTWFWNPTLWLFAVVLHRPTGVQGTMHAGNRHRSELQTADCLGFYFLSTLKTFSFFKLDMIFFPQQVINIQILAEIFTLVYIADELCLWTQQLTLKEA